MHRQFDVLPSTGKPERPLITTKIAHAIDVGGFVERLLSGRGIDTIQVHAEVKLITRTGETTQVWLSG